MTLIDHHLHQLLKRGLLMGAPGLPVWRTIKDLMSSLRDQILQEFELQLDRGSSYQVSFCGDRYLLFDVRSQIHEIRGTLVVRFCSQQMSRCIDFELVLNPKKTVVTKRSWVGAKNTPSTRHESRFPRRGIDDLLQRVRDFYPKWILEAASK